MRPFSIPKVRYDYEGQAANDLILKYMLDEKPRLIARFGNNELSAIMNYLAVRDPRNRLYKTILYLRSEIGPCWWDEGTAADLYWMAGVYPRDSVTVSRFAQRVLEDCKLVDILGSWQRDECRLAHLMTKILTVPLLTLEPYYYVNPWTSALAGRKVLVVHPFAQSIKSQYLQRKTLFKDQSVLPEFELQTVKAVQSAGGNATGFPTWFAALDWMCAEIARHSFDIAIIGAGAYGMSLGAFVKSLGKKAVHMGRATQLLFGIKGRRWDKWTFYRDVLYNEHWIRPSEDERPKKADKIEEACYW
jgi:hypothetical protein